MSRYCSCSIQYGTNYTLALEKRESIIATYSVKMAGSSLPSISVPAGANRQAHIESTQAVTAHICSHRPRFRKSRRF